MVGGNLLQHVLSNFNVPAHTLSLSICSLNLNQCQFLSFQLLNPTEFFADIVIEHE